MKKFSSVLCGLGLVAGVGLASPAGATPGEAHEEYTYDLVTMTTDDPRALALMDQLDATVPDWREQFSSPRLSSPGEQPVKDAINRAINPDDYECGATPMDAYVDGILADVDFFTLFVLILSGALDMPAYDALLFGTEGDPDYALPGDAKGLNKAFSKAQKFWDIESDDIQLIGMHSEAVVDVERATRLNEVLYGMSAEDAREAAEIVADMVNSDPALAGGDHPIFTLNAFAFSAEGETDPVIASVPDKIVMGEGVIDALNWMGLGSTGAQAVLGHEFAHHVQFERGLFASELEGPEATRRTELMADAFAAYFSAHRKGLNLRKDVILKVQNASYSVGDCQFDSPGHHGTPNQRLAAASWGADLAIRAQKQGHVLTIERLTDLFEAQLPVFVAPDA
ncbi:hypothetical protein [Ornithinimicrobium sp. Y1694]|uniref:hypothetical protein n=1 Tax=Ornithinimicrobium sp. Y1694 TaxID=3418590 RepID=UPI003CF3DD65